ncbi:hypothetical protein, partial [Muribaculum intestinale]
ARRLTALTVTFIIKQALNAYFSYGENRGGVAGKALPPLKKFIHMLKKHLSRCFGIAVCKVMNYCYKYTS